MNNLSKFLAVVLLASSYGFSQKNDPAAGASSTAINLSDSLREKAQRKIEKLRSIKDDKLSISYVDFLMQEGAEQKDKGPKLHNSNQSIYNSALFNKTPTGSYISSITHHGNNTSFNIKEASLKLMRVIFASGECRQRCSEEFLEDFEDKNKPVFKKLYKTTKAVIANEIANNSDYLTLYYGFSNKWRMYQDVLRVVKSFEYLELLDSTFPFRDFAFTDKNVSIDSFLKGWWDKYLEHSKEKGVSPFPKEGEKAEASMVGLTFFPDSITYARDYILSTNVNFFGNMLSPVNNTPFFFLNDTAASPEVVIIIDSLIKKLLQTYIKAEDGGCDVGKFDLVLQDIKNAFDKYMAKSGGQLAQIFIKKEIAQKTAYLAWNGGEPKWLSRATGKLIYIQKNNKNRPPNVFWPTTEEQINDYVMPNIVQVMDDYISQPKKLVEVLGVPFSIKKRIRAEKFVPADEADEFVTRDMLQARLLPEPEYFTDQAYTGVRLFTSHDVAPAEVTAYNEELFQIIHKVMSEFLARAKSEDDFKEGEYPLKRAFLEMKKNKVPESSSKELGVSQQTSAQ